MRSDVTDTERALPRRDPGDPLCPNPFCGTVVTIRGEFCSTCRGQQERQREAIRKFREQRLGIR